MRRAATVGLLAALALVCLGPLAEAELTREGSLIASFEGGISPQRLPRTGGAPVTVRVAGNVKTTQGMRLPQLRRIAVAINRAGKLDDRGIPTCRVRSIQPATEATARRVCAGAIVGDGEVTLVVRLPSQQDYVSRNKLLAFNGPHRGGKKLILAQVYSKNPPGSIVLTFTISKHRGVYGNVIETELPKYAEGWAYLTRFEMNLGRTFVVNGHRRSYISASCAAPKGFPGAVFPFGKASYSFGNGQVLTTKIVRSCRVAGK